MVKTYDPTAATKQWIAVIQIVAMFAGNVPLLVCMILYFMSRNVDTAGVTVTSAQIEILLITLFCIFDSGE